MTIVERRKYLKLMAPRYQQAKQTERSQLLSELEQVSKEHRKHLIRLLNGQTLDRKKHRTPQSRTYGMELKRVVKWVWESLELYPYVGNGSPKNSRHRFNVSGVSLSLHSF
jgi:hypothetical protein